MSVALGVVCEGSHDFVVLEQFLRKIISDSGVEISAIDCLQPEISATFQTGAGGWPQVKAWCEAQMGQGYRRYIDQPLFATSKAYDLLIIHLDGDVVEHCDTELLAGMNIAAMGIANIVTALKGAIFDNWLSVEKEHEDRLVACVPVRHLEAWLAPAIDPLIRNPETRPIKDEFRRGGFRRFRGTMRNRYAKAAERAAQNIQAIRASCQSFRRFEKDLKAAAAPFG